MLWAAFFAAEAAPVALPLSVPISVPAPAVAPPLPRGTPGDAAVPPLQSPSNALPNALPNAIRGVDDLLTAEVWLSQNRIDDARKLLLALETRPTSDPVRRNQVQFLLGLLDMQAADYASAVRRFRLILLSQPDMVRVRLEMGRALFLAGRYADAERQLLFARAGKVPEPVRLNIDRYLGQIRSAKRFSWGFSMAMAPDTNLNVGPAIDAVTLYGLPFQLSKDAKANSGVGLVLDTNAEWSPRLTNRLKWRFGTQFHRTQYGATTFDDMTLSGFSGPHFTTGRWDLNLLGNIARRWYGDHGYSQSYGPGLDATYYATYYLSAHWAVGVNGGLNQIDYDQNPGQSGLGTAAGLFSFYTPTASSYVRGAVTTVHQAARDAGFAYHSWQYGLSYAREFRGGITLGLAPAFTRMDYEAPLLAFGKARRDRQFTAQLSLLDRRLAFHGLTPRLAYTYTRNNSDISLYSFSRNHFEIGFAKAF